MSASVNDLILAIDPGRSTGWALSTGACGVVDLRGADDAASLARWHGWLANRFADGVKQIVIERPIFSSRIRGADFTVSLVSVAHMVAWLHDAKRAELMAVQVRKTMLPGVPSPTDKQRIQAAQNLGWNLTSDHAADAVLLLEAWKQPTKQRTR